jgi:hypothetical protein
MRRAAYWIWWFQRKTYCDTKAGSWSSEAKREGCCYQPKLCVQSLTEDNMLQYGKTKTAVEHKPLEPETQCFFLHIPKLSVCLKHIWATTGPRAGCGPLRPLIRPWSISAKLAGFMVGENMVCSTNRHYTDVIWLAQNTPCFLPPRSLLKYEVATGFNSFNINLFYLIIWSGPWLGDKMIIWPPN